MSDLTQLAGYDAFFCALGTRNETTPAEFRKVDFQYPLNFGNLAKDLDVPYFGLLSYQGANKDSIFVYSKTKGEIEEALKGLGLSHLAIFKPFLVINR